MSASLFFLSTIVVLHFFTTGYCLVPEDAVKPNDGLGGITDREIILALVKRIDDLEKSNVYLETWNRNQQKDIEDLQTTVQQQKRKLDLLERDEEQKKWPSDLIKTPNKPSIDVLSSSPQEEEVVKKHLKADSHMTRRQIEEVPQVAFYATASNHMLNLGSHQALEFENVTTNIGNAYNPHIGAFIAPFDGTYVFSVSIMGKKRENTHYYVALNGAQLSLIYVHGQESPYTTSSHTLVLRLNKGDDIEIRSYDSGNMVYGSSYSCFSGFLLYLDDGAGVIVG